MKREYELKQKDLKNIKEHDYFYFSYNDEQRQKLFDPSWCFDGKLIATKGEDSMYLVDTYWIGSDNRHFKLDEVLSLGTLTFICNLKDVEETVEYNLCYFDEEDIFDLSRQHGCYVKFGLRKGAKRSQKKMLETLTDKLEEAKRKVEYELRKVEEYSAKKAQVETGNLEIYI